MCISGNNGAVHVWKLSSMLRCQCNSGDDMAITAALLVISMVTGCSVGPAYHRPPAPEAPAYKELQGVAWEPAAPGDHLLRGNWWEVYKDPLLDAFEERIDSGNQDIAAAAANYFVARALVRLARSQYYPTVTTSPSITYARDAAIAIPTVSNQSYTATEYQFPVSAPWEPDLWARVRKSVAANTYAAQAAAADLENVRLLAHAELAIDYFQLRGTDEQKRILHATVLSYEDYLGLVRGLCKSGLDADEALAAAESALKAAQAQETNLGIARAEYEHAIAVLMGEAPSKVSIAVNPLSLHLPSIPVGIPADLLQRRPDIAAAERTMAQANAQIGVAREAFFPNVILGATGGIESLNVTDWFTWPSRFWSVGPVAAETLFDAGARRATVQQYRSLYDAAAANYRQTALTAFQQVEDQLAALNILSTDLQQQNEAVVSAQRYLRQAEVRNSAGLDPFLNVLTAQVSLLVYQQTYAVFQTQQMVASVQLVEALGGGWTTAQLPSPK
jgi:NodT family efflux transporter outer membrane factor (OMF) lipoprotein